MAGRTYAPVETMGNRICYSCGNSYPQVFRFCPLDSVDLDYLPQPVENLGRDLAQPKGKRWIAVSIISVFVLGLAAWMSAGWMSSAVPGTPGYGELTVRTTPSGAKVYLDGSQVGVSPLRLSDIPTGFHEVRAVCPGYSDGKAHVEILPSASQKLVWDLSPLPTRRTKDKNRYLASLPLEENAAVSAIPAGSSI